MTRRSKMEIYLDILRVTSDGNSKPTHIMYRANLSWERLKKYLLFLASQDLITSTERTEGTRYEITEKGWGYLANPPGQIEAEEPRVTTEGNYRRYCERYYGGNYRDHPPRLR